MAKNLKALLRNGEIVLGTWCIIPSSSVVNIISSAGLDFLIIDMEHGPHSFQTVEDMIRAAEVGGCAGLVRVSKNDNASILHALDLGASGVVIPHIKSREDAEKAISYSKYSPLGERGFSPFTRAGGYSLHNTKNHAKFQNTRTMIVLILEGRDGISSIDEILSISDIKDRIDVVYIGAYDLSQAMGMPGEVCHPKVKRCMRECIKKIKEKGVAAGGYVAKNSADIRWMCDMGMQFITVLPDCTVLFHAFEFLYADFYKIKTNLKRKKR